MIPKDLPIYQLEKELVSSLARQGRIILHAPTGSGKSTQVPQMLLDHNLAGGKQILILQPRRLATRMLAARVAQERGVKLGQEVGYQIRLDDVSSPETKIKYVTEGILLRQILSDPELKHAGALIFDEFHERHLYGDITLARALQIQETVRPDLKIIVMSATLALESLQRYLAPCETLSSEGRTFPVEIEYLDKPVDLDRFPIWDLAASELERILPKHPEGDVLIFMPGAYEIQRTAQSVQHIRGAKDFVVFPLHGELPPKEQDAAVARYDKRKIVVSTNVAETSLTIDGVRIVVDCGLARVAKYDPYRGINTLLIEKISRASADQRAGRAGRTAPGVCLRLWTEREHRDRQPQELPEVKRLDLAEVVLTLKASGVRDVEGFRWLEPPDSRSLSRAVSLLEDLGAIDRASGEITPLGRRMLAFPLHPRYARMLLAAHEYQCVRPVTLIAALTQGRNLLLRSSGKKMDEERDDFLGSEGASDFFRLMRAWRFAEKSNFDYQRCQRLGIHLVTARQVRDLFEQFLDIARCEGLDVSEKPASNEAIQKCILVGFSDHLARRMDSGTLRCQMVHGRAGVLARDSVVQDSPFLVAAEIREVQGRDNELNVLLSLATAVQEAWLKEIFPGDFSETRGAMFDSTLKRVVSQNRRQFRDLVLEEKSGEAPSPEIAARLLAAEVTSGRCVLKMWDEAVDQWIVRVNRLREWVPELEIPAITPEDRVYLIEQLCHGAISYKEIKDKPVWPVVKSWLSPQQQSWVDQYVPERLELPNGRKAKITYSAEGAPTLAARIQDLYGVSQTLLIADRRVKLVIQVLAPNHRPIQITQDLSVFWKESYPKIKQELQRKYPKHEWR